MKIDAKILVILNNIYKEILLRPVDQEGIKTYSQYIPYKENYVRKSLLKSEEYEQLNNKQYANIKKSNLKILPHTKINHIKGVKFQISQFYNNTKNILLLTLAKNLIINNNLEHLKLFKQKIQNLFKISKLSILTNNNIDNTINELNIWEQQDQDLYLIQHKNELISTIENHGFGNRIHKLSEYRNILLKNSLQYYNNIKFDYLMVFDSDINFDIDLVIEQIKQSISIDTEWSAISANGCFDKSFIHYDTLALRLPNQPIDIAEACPHFKTFYGKNFNWNNNVYVFNDFVETKAAFGGLTIYKGQEINDINKKYNSIYDTSTLPEGTCEHISLDLKLKNKHYINSSMVLPSTMSIEGQLYPDPVLFLPRDAGFFSVFNFLIGTMTRGIRAYPYFNKSFFLKNRGTNQHFCYWTDSENSWLDFFEPIRYYLNDNEHIDKSFLKYKLSSGEEAPDEFKIPSIFKEMLQKQTSNFQDWRKQTHLIYNKYIKINPKILKEAETIYSSMFQNHDEVVGIHYRHPSHSIESGQIFLQNYFDLIDEILRKKPKTKIFIASDTEFGIMAFKYKYKNKIKYIKNIDRLPIDNILEWAFALANSGKPDEVGIIKNKGYELHQSFIYNNPNTNYYNFTANLLYEVICLSRCNTIINSTSNISLALSYINPNLKILTL